MRKYVSAMAAVVLVAFCYAMARLPSLTAGEMSALARRFSFKRFPLPEVPDPPPYKFVRQVHPSLERISAWVSSMGAAVTLADLDADGLPNDLCYVDPRTDLVTVAPVPETGDRYPPFVLTPAPLAFDSAMTAPMGTLAGDFNEDGLMDLLVYYWGRTPVLFLRKKGNSVSRGVPLSRGDFVATELSESGERWYSSTAIQADLDGDLLPELYIANDFGPDRLLHNCSTPGHVEFALLEGRRDFTTPKSCVLGHDSFKGMGVDFGDVNGDGFLDIYVSNIATRFGLTESHFLWLSTGDIEKMKQGIAPYINASEELGLSRSGFSWEARLADFDNDGVLEAMQACGFIKGKINRWPELQALGTSNDRIVHDPRFWPNFKPGADLSGHDCNPFFVRGADGRYHNIAPALGQVEPMVSRGIAIADVDGDGRLDYATANQWGPSYFFKNESPNAGAFLGLRLVHPNGSPAIGAVARVNLPDGRKLVAQVDGGTGHSGRRSPDIHFGLGAWEKSKGVSVEIKWRDREGKIQQSAQQLPPGWHTLRLGKGDVIGGMPK